MYTEDEIISTINSFGNDKSPGYDKIHIKLLKNTINIIAKNLTLIYNIVFITGSVPIDWNLRIINPIRKAGKHSNYTKSYRPVALTSYLSKPLEKLASARLLSFAIRLKLLSNTHFGFVQSLGTIDAALYLIDVVHECQQNNDNKSCHCIFFDYSAAFDTVNRDRLLDYLENVYGINGPMLQYLIGFLFNRNTCTRANGAYSNWFKDTIGVPQGSPLSSILFLLFINPISVINNVCKFVRVNFYADDTNLCQHGIATRKLLTIDMQRACDLIAYYSKNNDLLLNNSKTKYIVFSNKRSIGHRAVYLDLSINGDPIPKEYVQVKFLGFILDRKLNFTAHINKLNNETNIIVKNIHNKFRFIKSIKADCINNLFKSLALGKLSYGAGIYAGQIKHNNITKLDPLRKTYNKCIRYLMRLLWSTPILFMNIISQWPDFDYYLLGKQANIFTRIIRTPSSNILYNRIFDKNDRNWFLIFKNDRFLSNITPLKPHNIIEEYYKLPHLNPINDEPTILTFAPQMKSVLSKLKNPKVSHYNIHNNPICQCYWASKLLQTSDWIFLATATKKNIPRRLSYNLPPLPIPQNLHYTNSEFTDDLYTKLNNNPELWENLNLNHSDIPTICIAGSDGSAKNWLGGIGWSIIDWNTYGKINLKKHVLTNKFAKFCIFLRTIDRRRTYALAKLGISNRCSIEFCELMAIVDEIDCIINNIKKQKKKSKFHNKSILLIIDNDTVIFWLTQKYKCTGNIRIYNIIKLIYNKIKSLLKFNISFYLFHVFSHKGTITNEIADTLAKIGLDYAFDVVNNNKSQIKHLKNWNSIDTNALKNEIKRIIKYKTQMKWINFRDNKNRNFTKQLSEIKFVHKRWLNDERKQLKIHEISIINQLRCKHIKLNYYNKKKLNIGDGLCTLCNKPETVSHFLFECTDSETSILIHNLFENINNIYKNESYNSSEPNIEYKTDSLSNLNTNSLDYYTDLTTDFDSDFDISNAFLYPFNWLNIAQLDEDDDYDLILQLRLQIITLIVNYYNTRMNITYDH